MSPFVRTTLITTFLFSKNPLKPNAAFSLFFSTNTTKQRVDAPTFSEFLINKHHFSPQSASRIASVLTPLKTLEKPDSILSFLKQSGFSNTQLEKIVNYRPRFLSANVEKFIKPKISCFRDFGLSSDEIADIISKAPLLLHCSVDNRLVPSLSVLKGLVGSNLKVATVLKRNGRFLATNLEKTLVPNIEFLKSCGLAEEQIIRFIHLFPRFLLYKPEYMRKFVERADELGVSRSSGMFIYAARVLSSMTAETWEQKLNAFRDLGFSEDDILRVFRNAPTVFSTSENKIKKVIEVLLGTGKYDMSCIVEYPTSLMYSVEKRYKPRIHILEVLEKRNLIKSWPGLGSLHLMSDERFYKKFVAPYQDEVGEADNAWTPYRKRRSRDFKVGRATTS